MTKRRVLKWLGIGFVVILVGVAVLGVWVAVQWPGHTQRSAADIAKALAEIQKQPRPISAQADDPMAGKVLDAIRRGLAYLKAHQEADGHFVTGRLAPKPAYTALVVSAFRDSPDHYMLKDHPFLQKAVQAILASQKADGAIYADIPGMTFTNYCTGLALVTLQDLDDPAYKPAVDKAAKYLRLGIHKGQKDDPNAGGFGYNPGARPDLNNTTTVVEALHKSGITKDDPIYKEIAQFLTHTQNNPETNDQKWATSDPKHKGGFVYRPGASPAGDWTDRDGQKHFASYGTMTYAGLVSFLYAYVDKNDPRVQSAWGWICRNYDLHENVNMKDVGLYYYYRIMAKALHVYGERYVVTQPDGIKHDWARELAEHLMSLQQADGSWVNANSQYLEGDHILVTAYALQALSNCYEQMTQPRENNQ